ncbi:ethanolamine ammonia-lyase subunit EutC [Telmatospirillum sp.]|uniref:ethanolamine ammonia-lyase subunit EutC n=1 Tax=Telmatospirillum sp. TaxID=2079197 RepID=UPI002851B779|nr:ethanolamine ammonia-lyase subunit EutC [Telmatospirillum sp.]MDR3437004.1 ethanolamine ammonia-lyase subunit EutC [Telmatospirillum sp.]
MSVPLDPWSRLRHATRARIGLGRSGDALPTEALLDFQQAHALARDAVHSAVDFPALTADLAPLTCLHVASQAADRSIYLRRPDLGRRLAADADLPRGDWDAVFVIADGLSASAVMDQAAPTLRACLARLPGWKLAPVVLASQARVALGDDIGERMGARLSVVLIGERPGLSVANSLGIYLTWEPRVGRKDSERNCLSNIHADGLSHEVAAEKLTWLMTEAVRRRLTGVALKENADALPTASRDDRVIVGLCDE